MYAGILARRGYRVRLLDVVPLHVDQAREDGAFEARVGDARRLEEEDESIDAVLLMGPLYHLTRRDDRLQALREARRVLRAGGVVLGVGITRFASLLDGLRQGFLAEPQFREIVERDLQGGPHLNPSPTERPEWFTTAYFHHPAELAEEPAEAGLHVERVLGIEGPAWLFAPVDPELALFAARAVEEEPTLVGIGSHLLVVARK